MVQFFHHFYLSVWFRKLVHALGGEKEVKTRVGEGGRREKVSRCGWNRERVTDWLAPPGAEATADICISSGENRVLQGSAVRSAAGM